MWEVKKQEWRRSREGRRGREELEAKSGERRGCVRVEVLMRTA